MSCGRHPCPMACRLRPSETHQGGRLHPDEAATCERRWGEESGLHERYRAGLLHLAEGYPPVERLHLVEKCRPFGRLRHEEPKRSREQQGRREHELACLN